MPLLRRHILSTLLLVFPKFAKTMELFRREPILRHRGVGQEGVVELAPRSLISVFGQPTDESWDSESLGAYYFVSQDDLPFTVYFRAYDQPATEVRRLRTEFWKEAAEYEFSIGALSQTRLAEFKAWLYGKTAR